MVVIMTFIYFTINAKKNSPFNLKLDLSFNEETSISIPAVMKKTSEKFKNHVALKYKNDAGEWKGITYGEYYRKVEEMAKVFIKLGLQKYGVVAILASNSVEWLISEMAAIHAG
jgi:long-chain-fatty-acid--CoA ligase ACSBG